MNKDLFRHRTFKMFFEWPLFFFLKCQMLSLCGVRHFQGLGDGDLTCEKEATLPEIRGKLAQSELRQAARTPVTLGPLRLGGGDAGGVGRGPTVLRACFLGR